MKISLSLVLLLTTLFSQSLLFAANDAQLATITKLGELNGVALQCRYLDQTQRMKRALVKNLPKQRYLGEHFDQTSNSSFMEFMSSQSSCPGADTFSAEVSLAILQLESAYTK